MKKIIVFVASVPIDEKTPRRPLLGLGRRIAELAEEQEIKANEMVFLYSPDMGSRRTLASLQAGISSTAKFLPEQMGRCGSFETLSPDNFESALAKAAMPLTVFVAKPGFVAGLVHHISGLATAPFEPGTWSFLNDPVPAIIIEDGTNRIEPLRPDEQQ